MYDECDFYQAILLGKNAEIIKILFEYGMKCKEGVAKAISVGIEEGAKYLLKHNEDSNFELYSSCVPHESILFLATEQNMLMLVDYIATRYP